MHIAYLINQYPRVSHSFIRREIQALERQGLKVMRISIRGWDEPLADADDLEERKRTRYVLRDGTLALILATLGLALAHPGHFLRAAALAMKAVLCASFIGISPRAQARASSIAFRGRSSPGRACSK